MSTETENRARRILATSRDRKTNDVIRTLLDEIEKLHSVDDLLTALTADMEKRPTLKVKVNEWKDNIRAELAIIKEETSWKL